MISVQNRLILSLFFCIFFLLYTDTVAKARDKTFILPDSKGAISKVVLSVNSARRSALRNTGTITNIVNALSPSVHIFILTNDMSAFTIARNPYPDRIHFIPISEVNPITIWPQDPFLVLQKARANTILLTSRNFQRAGDQVMAIQIANRLGYEIINSSHYFEGGNIVSDSDFVFIGANTIRLNAIEMGISEIEVVKGFERETGRKVLVIGPFPQPVGHIDMMITPLGNKTVVLADAKKGVEIVENISRTDPHSLEDFELFCEQYFFGSPSIKEVRSVDGKKIISPSLEGKTVEMIKLSKKIAPILDGIALSLKKFGYRVFRTPFLFGGPESLSNNNSIATQDLHASYPMLTYNNVLIENFENTKIVYLPQYGLQMLDKEATLAWEQIGYKVKLVKGLTISSMYGGSLRCSVKILERKNF